MYVLHEGVSNPYSWYIRSKRTTHTACKDEFSTTSSPYAKQQGASCEAKRSIKLRTALGRNHGSNVFS